MNSNLYSYKNLSSLNNPSHFHLLLSSITWFSYSEMAKSENLNWNIWLASNMKQQIMQTFFIPMMDGVFFWHKWYTFLFDYRLRTLFCKHRNARYLYLLTNCFRLFHEMWCGGGMENPLKCQTVGLVYFGSNMGVAFCC